MAKNEFTAFLIMLTILTIVALVLACIAFAWSYSSSSSNITPDQLSFLSSLENNIAIDEDNCLQAQCFTDQFLQTIKFHVQDIISHINKFNTIYCDLIMLNNNLTINENTIESKNSNLIIKAAGNVNFELTPITLAQLTTVQRLNLINVENGTMVYDTDFALIYMFIDDNWVAVTTGGGGVQSVTGSANIEITGTVTNPILNLTTTGVTANTYNYADVTVDIYGRITGISSNPNPVLSITDSANIENTGTATNPILNLIPTGVTASAYNNPQVTVDIYGRVTNIFSNPLPVLSVTGSANIAITGTFANPIVNLTTTGVTANTYNNANVTVDVYGRITNISANSDPVLSVTGSANINNSGTATDPILNLTTTGVTANTYNNPDVTVDIYGRITSITSGSSFVTGPISSIVGNIALFDDITGTLLSDSGVNLASKLSVDGSLPMLGNLDMNQFTVSNTGHIQCQANDLYDIGQTNVKYKNAYFSQDVLLTAIRCNTQSFIAGNGATSDSPLNVVIGENASCSGIEAIAIGSHTTALGQDTVVGRNASGGGSSCVYGQLSSSTGSSIVFGSNSHSTVQNANIFGSNITNTIANSVLIGNVDPLVNFRSNDNHLTDLGTNASYFKNLYINHILQPTAYLQMITPFQLTPNPTQDLLINLSTNSTKVVPANTTNIGDVFRLVIRGHFETTTPAASGTISLGSSEEGVMLNINFSLPLAINPGPFILEVDCIVISNQVNAVYNMTISQPSNACVFFGSNNQTSWDISVNHTLTLIYTSADIDVIRIDEVFWRRVQ